MTAKTTEDRMRYAKQYAFVLISGYTQISSSRAGYTQILQLTPNKRIHVMKALSALAKYLGCYDSWTVTSRKYQLSWSTGTEKLDAFTRFFDDSCSLDIMLHQLQEAIKILPSQYSRFLIFCTLTGLRGSEAIEAVRLLHDGGTTMKAIDTNRLHMRTTMKAGRTNSLLLRTKHSLTRTIQSKASGTRRLHGRTTQKEEGASGTISPLLLVRVAPNTTTQSSRSCNIIDSQSYSSDVPKPFTYQL